MERYKLISCDIQLTSSVTKDIFGGDIKDVCYVLVNYFFLVKKDLGFYNCAKNNFEKMVVGTSIMILERFIDCTFYSSIGVLSLARLN